MIGIRTVSLAALSLACAAGAAYAQGRQPANRSKFDIVLQGLNFREIGPAVMGGRIDDLAVDEKNPSTVYIGTASGGVWKTINSGTTWEPVFDREAVSTIGAIRVAPSEPSIVWVGTGEPNNRQSSSWGDGVYKSMDGGKTWTNMGLKDSHHIGRIAIHPTDPNVVYVAALGRLWGPNRERGVFKTTDGGKTWTHSLFLNEDTGAVDIAMDPQTPNTLYAAAYQRRRTVFGFNGGGPHGGLYKTTNGGATWTRLTAGLPQGGDTGRIAVNLCRSNPKVLYATVEHARGGVFRSEDRGETWTKVNDTNERPSYFSKIYVDPNDAQKVWMLGRPIYYSQDGGKTFQTDRGRRLHPDHQALWINPANSDHMIGGSDGGIHWSYDGGRTWDYTNTLALGQFYGLGFDMRRPYYLCGGLQDNGNWCGPSATLYHQGITNEEWFRLGGNDGMYMEIDPTDHNIIYVGWEEGNLARRNLQTTEMRSIRPKPQEGEPPYRFQWTPPLLLSPHDPKTIYFGAQFLFQSRDRGETWTKLGGDLTTGVDRTKLPILGKAPDRSALALHDGVAAYPCLTTISESPLRAGLLWVGTDDGNLQVSRDGGTTWRNVADRVPGVPRGTYVSRVVASRHAEGTAYVTFDGHRSNDFNIYVFMTTDSGQTWKAISEGIPRHTGIVHVIREHFRNPNLLFAGTEYGAYVSFDRGGYWSRITSNLPTVPVRDIAVHPRDNDLILGTHGRSIWILDDITPLEELSEKILSSDLHLFDIRPAVLWRVSFHKRWIADKIFVAKNPPYGALISYYLNSTPAEKLKITVWDEGGKLIRELDAPNAPGVNRVNWDLRWAPPAEPTRPQQITPQIAMGFTVGPRGPRVDPGQYTVRITLGANVVSKTVKVEDDPRISISDTDRRARRDALLRSYEMYKAAVEGQKTAARLRTTKTAEAFGKQLAEVQAALGTSRQRADRLMTEIEDYTAAPTPQQLGDLDIISRLLSETTGRLKRLAGPPP